MRVKNTKSASKKHAMSDRSSVRDSEERGSSVPGRAAKRARGDNDIQTVRQPTSSSLSSNITLFCLDCFTLSPPLQSPRLLLLSYPTISLVFLRRASNSAHSIPKMAAFDIPDMTDMSELSEAPSGLSDLSSLSGAPSDLPSNMSTLSHEDSSPQMDGLPSDYASDGDSPERDNEDTDETTSQEEDFYEIPSLHFELTDNLKALLVDDWERVTKNFSVVKLPAPKPVRQILQDWHDDEFPKRVRIEQDVLKTVMNGTMEYFDIVLEKSLLYRYERAQYRHMKETYQSAEGTGPSDIYGAEHLLRCLSTFSHVHGDFLNFLTNISLTGTMGDNLAPTDMTAPQARVWRTQMANFSLFLSRNSDTYFRCEYIPIEDSYGDKKKSGR